ncbi:uncharacterized protein LOC119332078 [Triticum dicoccoides]|uniref:uncharacterized protein LOC119332078 n=1 Tax=Triticum dicoccoides TaxID=85692 RepID=UPI00189163D0|nr:uncharacterized protein LOC119332078 [Triticum dicoccoides]
METPFPSADGDRTFGGAPQPAASSAPFPSSRPRRRQALCRERRRPDLAVSALSAPRPRHGRASLLPEPHDLAPSSCCVAIHQVRRPAKSLEPAVASEPCCYISLPSRRSSLPVDSLCFLPLNLL